MNSDIDIYTDQQSSRQMSVNQEVAFALYVQVFHDFGGVEHNGAGGAVKHDFFLGEDIVLDTDSISCQEEDCFLAEYHRLQPMDPKIVSSSNVAIYNFSLLTIHPIGEEQQDIALGLYYVICDFPLAGFEVFGTDVHANGKGASNRLVLGRDEVEVSKFAALFGPKCVVVVEVAFAVVEDELACPVYDCC